MREPANCSGLFTRSRTGEFGNETWENGSWKYTGNTGVWSMMSADGTGLRLSARGNPDA